VKYNLKIILYQMVKSFLFGKKFPSAKIFSALRLEMYFVFFSIKKEGTDMIQVYSGSY